MESIRGIYLKHLWYIKQVKKNAGGFQERQSILNNQYEATDSLEPFIISRRYLIIKFLRIKMGLITEQKTNMNFRWLNVEICLCDCAEVNT